MNNVGYLAVLITSTFFEVGKHEGREIYRTLAQCEIRVQEFRNSSFYHRGFCTPRTVTEDDVRVYGGWKVR